MKSMTNKEAELMFCLVEILEIIAPEYSVGTPWAKMEF
jgi:hypothetical protein